MIKYFCDRCKKECDSYSLLSVNPIMWDEMSLSIDTCRKTIVRLMPLLICKSLSIVAIVNMKKNVENSTKRSINYELRNNQSPLSLHRRKN